MKEITKIVLENNDLDIEAMKKTLANVSQDRIVERAKIIIENLKKGFVNNPTVEFGNGYLIADEKGKVLVSYSFKETIVTLEDTMLLEYFKKMVKSPSDYEVLVSDREEGFMTFIIRAWLSQKNVPFYKDLP